MAKRNIKPRKRTTDDVLSVEEEGEDLGDDFAAETPISKAKSTAKSAVKPKSKTKSKTATKVKTGGSHRLHNYDKFEKPRNLSKKAKLDLAEWKGDNRSQRRDAYFLSQAIEAKKKFGHQSVLAGNESNQLVVGIPMPSLALEWLFVQDVLPLSVMIMIVGKWRTCKSGFLYEVFRWFDKYNGGAILMDVETKFSPDLCSSIMGYAENECPIIVNRCSSLDDWQERMTFFLKEQKSKMIGTKEKPGPGRTIPICFAVDSMMGKSSQEKQDKISEIGSAGRSYPVEAMMITEYLRSVAHEFDNWPFSLAMVNHHKLAINAEGHNPEMRKPGGDFASFQMSFELATSVWKKAIDTVDFDGIGVRLTCEKNSFGVTGRDIKTRMLWWDEIVGNDDQGNPVYAQKTVWDWDWSTITMLNELPNKYKLRLRAVDFDLAVQSPKADVECMAHSKALGMGKDDWLPFHEVGAMIRNSPEIMNRLRTTLSIKRRAQLDGDFLEQINKMGVKLV